MRLPGPSDDEDEIVARLRSEGTHLPIVHAEDRKRQVDLAVVHDL